MASVKRPLSRQDSIRSFTWNLSGSFLWQNDIGEVVKRGVHAVLVKFSLWPLFAIGEPVLLIFEPVLFDVYVIVGVFVIVLPRLGAKLSLHSM